MSTSFSVNGDLRYTLGKKRKIYHQIYEWKENKSNQYALLIKGARRVGKSTIVEEFAKKNLSHTF